jgi:long-chain acyl-CoA synthetase
MQQGAGPANAREGPACIARGVRYFAGLTVPLERTTGLHMPGFLPDLLKESADARPDDTAIVAGPHRLSFRELDGLTDSIAVALEQIGGTGRRVGLLLPNHPLFPALLHGILRAGGSALMMNPQYSPREAREVLADAGADTVVTATPLLPLLPQNTRAVLVESLPTYLRVTKGGDEETIPLRRGVPEWTPADGDAEAVVVYTAATTGRARGARLSHRNLIANCRSTVKGMQLTPDDRTVAVLPFIHLFGQTVTLNGPLAAGSRVYPVERFNPLRLLDLLEQERITVISGVPGIFSALATAAERRGAPQHALRVAISGGSPLPQEVARRWEEQFGMPLREGYGLTEAAPVCLFNRVDRPNHSGTMGYPFPDVEVTVRGPGGEELPHGEVGEICIRGDNVFLGYIGEDGRSAHDFHGDWLRTGDLGNVEGDGVIRYRGLLKAMFTRNGFNVYPAEVSRVLEEDPRIARVRVCALPDPVKENDIVLFVEREPGASLSEEDVRDLCRHQLAAFKQPTRIEFVDEQE